MKPTSPKQGERKGLPEYIEERMVSVGNIEVKMYLLNDGRWIADEKSFLEVLDKILSGKYTENEVRIFKDTIESIMKIKPQ